MINTDAKHPMYDIVEGCRQLIREGRNTKLDGIPTLEAAEIISAKLKAADVLMASIEELMEHPYEQSRANGMINNKPARRHTDDLQAENHYESGRRRQGMDQSFGHRTQPGEGRLAVREND